MTATVRDDEARTAGNDPRAEVRLCHLPGRADLALVCVAAPPGTLVDGCGDALRAVAPHLGACAAAAELSMVVVVLTGPDADLSDRDPAGLAAGLAGYGLPLVLVVDGVRGPLVDALAGVAGRTVLGPAQADRLLPAPEGAVVVVEESGAGLVQRVLTDLRGGGVPALS